MIKLFLICSLLFIGFQFAGAQPNIIFPNLDVKEGDQFSVGLPVENFNNIVGVQFSMQWNPEVIQFVSAGGVNLPNASEPFGEAFVDSGTLTFLWVTADISTGITLDSGQILFTVHFQTVGTVGDSTQLAITNYPTPVLVLNNSGANVGLTHEGGLIRIDEPISTNNPVENSPVYLSVYPTYTQEQLNIELNTDFYMHSSVAIYSLSGHLVFSEPWLLLPGNNLWSLNIASKLPNGMYVVVIDTGKGLKSSRFVLSR